MRNWEQKNVLFPGLGLSELTRDFSQNQNSNEQPELFNYFVYI